jgi:alpha-amylase/alpha-mannosidase (GH57 family)
MPDDIRLKVVLCWHMHQPQYRDLVSGIYHLPWTYLHAVKDYTDMAAHLEAVPAARAVINFAPLLLEQIEDYAKQVEGFLTNSLAIRDPLLAALISPALPPSEEERIMLIKSCVRANETRMIGRFPAYHHLVEMAAWFTAHP